jgi:hypothetical protein
MIMVSFLFKIKQINNVQFYEITTLMDEFILLSQNNRQNKIAL